MLFYYIAICLCLSKSLASNITYENVTQSNFTELGERVVEVPGLNHLFFMSRNFVDLVFQPFSVIEEFIFELLEKAGNGFDSTFVNSLLDNWQKLVSFEVGFAVCFAFGCIFIILVPLIGIIMCCCRSCCNNCGGEMEQSVKRAKSNWRYCFCGTLIIFTIFMAIPCIFVFLTNAWASEALRQIPTVTQSALNDLDSYITNVPNQLQHIINEYQKLDSSLRSDINGIGNTLGIPIRDHFLDFTQPTLDRLTDLSNDTKAARDALVNVQDATERLNAGIGGMNSALNSTQAQLNSDLDNAGSTCTGNPACVVVRRSTTALDSTGANFSSLNSIQNELTSINNTLNQFDIDQEVNTILDSINNIPANISSSSQAVTDDVTSTLNTVNGSLNSAVNALPIDAIANFSRQLDSLGDTVSNVLTDYNRDYDSYRYAAGAVLGSVIAIVVLFYWFGILFGTVSFSQYASERNGWSNCGGILMMAAVGLSFIFSWLLMILVIITFTVGGHGERYLCQNLEFPYEGLKFADRVINETGVTGTFTISLFTTVQECEKNRAIYVAAELENTYNVSAEIQRGVASIDNVRRNLDNLSVDLTSINTYPRSIEDALDSMRNSGIDNINFTAYIDEISKGLTSSSLLTYAQFLNDSADNMTTFNSSAATANLANTIRGHSYDILQIQANHVDPLSQSLSTLNSSILRLQGIATGFNGTINALEQSLIDLNVSIQNNGSQRVLEITRDFADDIISDVFGYVNYVVGQLTEQFGACRPVFVVYVKMTQVLCGYLVEILNGFWFSLGWCVFFLIPSAIVGMKLAKFYRAMPENDDKEDAQWNDMEMESMAQSNNNNSKRPSSKLRRDDRVDEVARAMSVLTDHVGVSSSSSVIRSFRAVKSAKEAEFPAMGDPVQRFAHSAASNEDDVIRRWNQSNPVLAAADRSEQDQTDSSSSPEHSDTEMEKKSARSGALGESRAEIHRTRNVKSLAHAAQPSVESRDARRTVSDVKDAAAILMRWNQSSKVHPEQYY